MSAILWAKLFALTLSIEGLLVVPMLGAEEPSRVRRVIILLAAQLATHPLVCFAFPQLPLRGFPSLVCSELYAWLFESALYWAAIRGLSPVRALGIAGVANGISFSVGLVLLS